MSKLEKYNWTLPQEIQRDINRELLDILNGQAPVKACILHDVETLITSYIDIRNERLAELSSRFGSIAQFEQDKLNSQIDVLEDLLDDVRAMNV